MTLLQIYVFELTLAIVFILVVVFNVVDRKIRAQKNMSELSAEDDACKDDLKVW
jgi:hypothetical protein